MALAGFMGPLADLLATDQRQALEFFVLHLREISGPVVDRQELLYNASVLAHHALVSTAAEPELASPGTLSSVFEQFVAAARTRDDRLVMEVAGAQCLLLAGFFEDQMRHRHNIRWYAELGASFFSRAARAEALPQKARLLDSLSVNFERWRRRHALLSRSLRTQPYLLGLPRLPGST